MFNQHNWILMPKAMHFDFPVSCFKESVTRVVVLEVAT